MAKKSTRQSSKSESARVLVVDDSMDTLELIERHLSGQGIQVFTASGVEEAIRVLKDVSVHLVITDMKMPRIDGLELIRHIRETYKSIRVIMVTGYPSVESAVKAVKEGADEYLSKPFTKTELLTVVNAVLDQQRQQQNLNQPDKEQILAPSGLIGDSDAMKSVFQAIQKAAQVKATVLISGESGTGKELVARAIHYNSARASQPFVPVNCGGIPENLLESELFGHVRGAYTGATETRAGFFQTADKGTLFLDEAGETSLAMQVKLLRVLQEKEVCMIGSSKPQPIDVRIIAGTNKDLLSLTKSGRFREDLYYRLNVINIDLPPLRDRGDDVLLLIRHFTDKYAQENGRAIPKYSDRALRRLLHYHWPGNVRELENLVQRMLAMGDGDTIDAPDLPAAMRSDLSLCGDGLSRSLAEVEAEYIRRVLKAEKGNKTRTATILGIDRKTLREKMKRYGLSD